MVHQVYQMQRILQLHGQDAIFCKMKENIFHEPDGYETVLTCKALFHEANLYLNTSIVEPGKVQEHKEPKLLVVYSGDIHEGDRVQLAGRKFEVGAVDDLGNLHMLLDLSLQEV